MKHEKQNASSVANKGMALPTLTEETGFELGRRHAGGIREAGRVKWRRWI